MQDGYLITMGITIELILFGALSGALYYVYRCLAVVAGWSTLGLSGVVGRVDLDPGR